MGRYNHLFPIEGLEVRQRQRSRLKLFVPVEIECANGRRDAHLLDLSKFGGRLHAHVPPHVGEVVRIHHADGSMTGTVLWVKGNGCGVTFLAPLSREALAPFVTGSY
jgi:hypothetical protein